MKVYYLVCSLVLALVLANCSGSQNSNSAVIKGKITASDSVDTGADLTGTAITIVKKDSPDEDADTLFYDVTDKEGVISGTVEFPRRGRYQTLFSRDGRNIAQAGLILADEDTLTITGKLSDLEGTLSVKSREHDALKTYQRMDRNLQRILAYAQAGALKGDSLEMELAKWSNLFWDVYEEKKGTIGSELAASESIRLLQGWNNEAMMDKIRMVHDQDELATLGATYGKDYLAEKQGLGYALQYLDSLQALTQRDDVRMRISMEQIKLLYDSARVEQAKSELSKFEESFQEGNARVWADAMRYDLNYLSPGDSIPSFSFVENGSLVSRDSMIGTPYILEISTLSNPLYQEQYDRTVVIHSLYKTFGLQVVTLPLDNSQITINAFFEERVKPWPVASADAYDREELINRFNVQVVPTRFLIDREGKIVRKYVGREYADIIQGIQTLITNDEPAS